jgi:23S rRNA pseudouridine2605 synthase/16S rRNA pseudouridine516 synthase
MQERLHKVLARAGIGSRRQCERLIAQGLVVVNGKTVTDMGTKVDPQKASIKVDGKMVKTDAALRAHNAQYLVLYKPRGVLTTMKPDPEKRSTILDLLPARLKTRIFPVGRLDFNSEGLVLLTNDGELAYRLTHPKFKLPKTYEVKVHGIPTPRILKILSQGVNLEEGRTQPASVRIIRHTRSNAWLSITLHEGKKRQIRRMCAKVRLPVSKLRRISIGPIKLQGLERGKFRYLRPDEVKKLKAAVKLT